MSLYFLFPECFHAPLFLFFLISDSDCNPVCVLCTFRLCLGVVCVHVCFCEMKTTALLPTVTTHLSSLMVVKNSLTLAFTQSIALKWSCKIIIIFIKCFFKAFCLQNETSLVISCAALLCIWMCVCLWECGWCSWVWVHQRHIKSPGTASTVTTHRTAWGETGTQNKETSASAGWNSL